MGTDLQEQPLQSTGSYLYDVLADGARLFPFRSSVSSLLGLPDSGYGLKKTYPIFPPGAFMRPQFARKGCINPERHLSASTRSKSSSPEVLSNKQYGSYGEECEVTELVNMNIHDEKTIPEICSDYDGAERENLTTKRENAASGINIDKIEIPGVTDNKVEFHALLTSAEGTSHQDNHIHDRISRDDNKSNGETVSDIEQSQAQDREEIICSKKPDPAQVDINRVMEPVFHKGIAGKVATGITVDRIDISGITGNKVTLNHLSTTSKGLYQPDEQLDHRKSKGEIRTNAAIESLIEKREGQKGKNSVRESLPDKQLQCNKETTTSYKICAGIPEETLFRETNGDLQANSDLSGHSQLTELLKKKAAFKIQDSRVLQNERDMAGILNTLQNHLLRKIDQLRDASKKRTIIGATITEESEKNREQDQVRQMQIPQQQRFVVVRHISRRNTAPAAFWERSYLGRFRLRPLR